MRLGLVGLAFLVCSSIPAVGKEQADDDLQAIRALAESCEAAKRDDPAKWETFSDAFKLYCTEARLVVATRLAEAVLHSYREHLAICPMREHEHGAERTGGRGESP